MTTDSTGLVISSEMLSWGLGTIGAMLSFNVHLLLRISKTTTDSATDQKVYQATQSAALNATNLEISKLALHQQLNEKDTALCLAWINRNSPQPLHQG